MASETATAADTSTSNADFFVQLDDSAAGSDATLVAPSTFNVQVNEAAEVIAEFLASAAFFATITDSAVAADSLVRRLLWEIINDAQAVNWGDVNNAQTSVWGAVNASQSVTWSAVNTAETSEWGVIDDSQNTTWHTVRTQI